MAKHVTRLEAAVAVFLGRKSNFSRIAFTFNGKRVSPDHFAKVAAAVRANRVQVVTTFQEAGYDHRKKKNSLKIPIQYRENRVGLGGYIVHEAVHAYSDLQGKPVLVDTDEGCAYIAQALFVMSQKGAMAVADRPLREMAMFVSGAKGLSDGKEVRKRFLQWLRNDTPHGKLGHTGKYEYDG